MTISKNEAKKLWNRLRSNLLALDQTITEIVEERAWEPMGYASFTEAWEKELHGIELKGAQLASAVLALYDSGATPVEVASAVNGVGPEKAKAYEKAHSAGLTPKLAYDHVQAMSSSKVDLGPRETWVGAHIRKVGEKKNSIKMEGFTDSQMGVWKKHCSKNELNFNKFCKEIFEEAMNNATGH